MTGALINVPKTARLGEIIEIKAMIAHIMETGYRRDAKGAAIPRNIISRFTCLYEGEEIFSADFFPAVAANPFLAFSTVVTKSGTFTFTWSDDQGNDTQAVAEITVA